jgi:hypothetical protein
MAWFSTAVDIKATLAREAQEHAPLLGLGDEHSGSE